MRDAAPSMRLKKDAMTVCNWTGTSFFDIYGEQRVGARGN